MDGRPIRLLSRSPRTRARQDGVVLLVALVVLVAITIAGLAMVRSVDTTTLIAGNLAFQQAATRASDKGIEEAVDSIQYLGANSLLDGDEPTRGYYATLAITDVPTGSTTWQTFWKDNYEANAKAMPADQYGNQVSYVIHRACLNAAPPGSGGTCAASPAVTKATGNSNNVGDLQLEGSSQIYYRITVRVLGPRRTESYVQSYIAM